MDNKKIINVIILEGVDCTYKNTIGNKLIDKFQNLFAQRVMKISFPTYGKRSAEMVTSYLRDLYEPSDKTLDKDKIFEQIHIGDTHFYKSEGSTEPEPCCIKYIRLDGKEATVCIELYSKPLYLIYIKDKDFNKIILNKNDQNIFKFGTKPSGLIKSQLYTVNRVVDFNNDMDSIEECDLLILDRSYLSNFLFQTVDMNFESDLIQYMIALYVNELKATGLSDESRFRIFPFYLYHEDIEYNLKCLYERSIRENRPLDIVEKDKNYLIQVYNNYFNKKEMLEKIDINFADFNHIKKFFTMYDFKVSEGNTTLDLDVISDNIIKIVINSYNKGCDEDER